MSYDTNGYFKKVVNDVFLGERDIEDAIGRVSTSEQCMICAAVGTPEALKALNWDMGRMWRRMNDEQREFVLEQWKSR